MKRGGAIFLKQLKVHRINHYTTPPAIFATQLDVYLIEFGFDLGQACVGWGGAKLRWRGKERTFNGILDTFFIFVNGMTERVGKFIIFLVVCRDVYSRELVDCSWSASDSISGVFAYSWVGNMVVQLGVVDQIQHP